MRQTMKLLQAPFPISILSSNLSKVRSLPLDIFWGFSNRQVMIALTEHKYYNVRRFIKDTVNENELPYTHGLV